MSDADVLEEMRILAEFIKQNSGNLSVVYRTAGQIINKCRALSGKSLAQAITNEAVAIMSSVDPLVIQARAEKIKVLTYVAPVEKSEDEKQKSCIQPTSITKTKQYMKDCEKYRSQADIEVVEVRIQTFPCTKHLHEKVVSGKWEGYWHARLTGNLRIIYLYDYETKELVYNAIITKNEFDNG